MVTFAIACGVVSLGELLVAFEQSMDWEALGRRLEGDHHPISAPTVVLGIGAGDAGRSESVALGWTWGERIEGGLVPGSTTVRVLVSYAHHREDRTAIAITAGLTQSHIGYAALDGGVELDGTSVTPILQLTLGYAGAGIRFSGGIDAAGDTQGTWRGAIALVVDVGEVAR